MTTEKKKTALLLVDNNDGIIQFARQLLEVSFNILTFGETAIILRGQRIVFTDILSLVGRRTLLDQQIDLLPREVFLGLVTKPEHQQELDHQGIPRIDLVYADLLGKQKEQVSPKKGIDNRSIAIYFAIEGKRIPICELGDCEKIIEWLKGDRSNENNVLGFFSAKAAMAIGEGLRASSYSHFPYVSDHALESGGEIRPLF